MEAPNHLCIFPQNPLATSPFYIPVPASNPLSFPSTPPPPIPSRLPPRPRRLPAASLLLPCSPSAAAPPPPRPSTPPPPSNLLSILPLPQVVIWKFLHRPKGTAVLSTKDALLFIVFVQYVPRLVRIYPLSSELKRTSGVIAETAYAGAAYHLLWYLLASHIVGAFWYLLLIERVSDCWRNACNKFPGCNEIYMYCGNDHQKGFQEWRTITRQVIHETCEPTKDGDMPFNYGIYSPEPDFGIDD